MTEHLPLALRLQLAVEFVPAAPKPPVGVPDLDQLTVPEGVVDVPGEVSVTVASQLVEEPQGIDPGTQATTVRVARVSTVRLKFPLEVAWMPLGL